MSKVLKNNIYELRQEKKITQEELGSFVSVSRQTIISIEKGNYTPSVGLAILFAKFFNIPVEKIFWYDK